MPALGHVFAGFQTPRSYSYTPAFSYMPSPEAGGRASEPTAPAPSPAPTPSSGGMNVSPSGGQPVSPGQNIGLTGWNFGIARPSPWTRYVVTPNPMVNMGVKVGSAVWNGSGPYAAVWPGRGMPRPVSGSGDPSGIDSGRAPDFSYTDREAGIDRGLGAAAAPDLSDRRDKDDDVSEE